MIWYIFVFIYQLLSHQLIVGQGKRENIYHSKMEKCSGPLLARQRIYYNRRVVVEHTHSLVIDIKKIWWFDKKGLFSIWYCVFVKIKHENHLLYLNDASACFCVHYMCIFVPAFWPFCIYTHKWRDQVISIIIIIERTHEDGRIWLQLYTCLVIFLYIASILHGHLVRMGVSVHSPCVCVCLQAWPK